MIIPSREIHVGWVLRFHFVMTLRWTFPWVILSSSHFLILLWFFLWSHLRHIGSHIIISVGYMSDLLYFPPWSYSWVIKIDRIHMMSYWGIFPSSSCRGDGFLTDLLQFSSLGREILYMRYCSLFLWFSSRWAFSGAWRSSCDCPTICDPAVDCFDEIVVVTPTDYSLETL